MLQKKRPAAFDLLNLCAFLAPDGIPKELLVNGTEGLPSAWQNRWVIPSN